MVTGVRRAPLAVRIALVTTAVAAVAVIVGGLISVGLVRDAARTEAREALRRQADVTAAGVEAAGPKHRNRAVRLLREQGEGITVARLGRKGRLKGPPLAQQVALRRIDEISAGKKFGYETRVGGGTVYAEVRPIDTGGAIVVAQREADAEEQVGTVVSQMLAALLVGLGVAVLAGCLFAWRLAVPLKRTAGAARLMASGRRDVRVPPRGPAEVADVATSFNSLADTLADSEDRQRQFLVSVSHELRTPLTAIKGFGEALSDGVTTGDAAQLAGRTIVSESDRLERLVSDIFDLARLGAQDFGIEVTRVDLADLMSRAADVWAARCRAVGVRFDVELPSAPLVILTDAGRVRQIVDGLAENALRVTPAGRDIVLASRAETGHAVVEVRDGGPGLSPEDVAVAFQRSVLYERYRGVRRVGTGVGLALVHGLATRLGGTAEAGYAPEGGARFTIRLPFGSPPAA